MFFSKKILLKSFYILIFFVMAFTLLFQDIKVYGSSGIEMRENKSNYFGFEEKISYSKMKEYYEKQGLKPVEDVEITIKPDMIVSSSNGNIPIVSDLDGNAEDVLLWTDEYDWFEWEFYVNKAGLYEIDVEYYPFEGTGSTIQRAIWLDGKVPFEEANNIPFYRVWKEEGKPKVNNIGNEVWPKQIEEKKWLVQTLADSAGFQDDPLLFYLSEGKHTLRMVFVDQPMAIGKIILKSPQKILSYAEVLDMYKKNGYKEATKIVKFQAEETEFKNDPTIRRESSSDPKTDPMSPGHRLLNVMGARRWKSGNQSITWKFNIEEDGLYKISMRLMQNYDDGLPSYRQIIIDGKIPFEELKAYKFEFVKDWREEILEDENGEPYLFYFTKGEHEITMTVKHGALGNLVERTKEDLLFLSELNRKIIMITGTDPDPNYEYELDRKIPGLIDDLLYLANRMDENADILVDISSKVPSMANNYRQIGDQLRDLASNPDKISKALKDLENAQVNLGSYITSLQSRPLVIDYFIISPPNVDNNIKKSNFLERLKVTFINFLSSFSKDYNSIGNIYKDEEDGQILNVWIARGKEWAEILKEMADEDFTPKTGININMNVVPSGQLGAGSVNTLMLSIISGTAPDVALGVDARSPVEFAFRDAVTDLTTFSDFKEVAERFYPSILIPYRYKNGVFALPETMDFTVLFYRKDIVQELGLKIPDTWNEVYQDVLPKLYENNMNFYYPSTYNGYGLFLFQNGGSYYKDNGTRSALDTPEAYKAFKQWTDLFISYGIPVETNFFTRMRNGDTPIGIAGYSHYMQLSTSAPELYGRWSIAPVPGIEKADGTIDRSVGSIASQACIIMAQSEKKQEAWEFIKWWTSEEVQTRYGRELEALLGVEARWNTANVNAFNNLPWDKEHIKVIQYQLSQANEEPVVLGGYYTSRHLTNAWNRIVLNSGNVYHENARDSLERAVKDINKELKSKQEEYGYSSNRWNVR